MKPSLSNVPIIWVILKSNEFSIIQGSYMGTFDGFCPLLHDPVDSSTIGKIDGIATDISIMPVEDVNSPFWTSFQTKANPCKIVGRNEVFTVTTDIAGAFGLHDVSQELVLMDVAHEELVSVLFWEGIR